MQGVFRNFSNVASIQITADNTDEVLRLMESAKAAALEEMGQVGETYAKMKCPVDTGRLRNSITHTSDGKSAYVGTNVEYAPYVEYGTVKTTAQPFLKPAATEHTDTYKAIVKKHLENV